MGVVGDLISGVVESVEREVMKKAQGKRARRRKRTATPTERVRKIEKLLRPAKKQVSRKRSVRTRSKAKRRAV